jgi:hypothetical protein
LDEKSSDAFYFFTLPRFLSVDSVSGMDRTDAQRQFHAASFAGFSRPPDSARRVDDPQFDIFDWYPKYQSCQRYFTDHAQHSVPVQALAAFVNILLPSQRPQYPLIRSVRPESPASSSRNQGPPRPAQALPGTAAGSFISLIPYIRRLVVTGMDFPGVLHGFFGDDWRAGVGPLHEQERRNYLFAAKSGGWESVKRDYDMLPMETVPFLRPLQKPLDVEIEGAERAWSQWLAMEDWMVGSRAPDSMNATAEAPDSDEV